MLVCPHWRTLPSLRRYKRSDSPADPFQYGQKQHALWKPDEQPGLSEAPRTSYASGVPATSLSVWLACPASSYNLYRLVHTLIVLAYASLSPLSLLSRLLARGFETAQSSADRIHPTLSMPIWATAARAIRANTVVPASFAATHSPVSNLGKHWTKLTAQHSIH